MCNFVHCFICQHYVSIKVFLTLEKTKERMRRTLFQVLFPLLSFSVHNGIKFFELGFDHCEFMTFCITEAFLHTLKFLKVAFSQKGLMRLSFLQTDEPNYFPELEFGFFFPF